MVASLSKYFTFSWDWLLGKGGAEGSASSSSEGTYDSGGDGGNAAAADGVSVPSLALPASYQPEMVEYGGKLMAFEPADVSFARLGELSPPETPAAAREELSTGLAA